MPDGAKQIVESLTYDGVLGWFSALWVFLGLALFVGWMLWRERRVTGTGTAWLFFALRMAATGLVLWMLLGPTRLTIETTTIPHTLAIVVDDSQSMDLAEPLPRVERLRWQLAAGGEVSDHQELVPTDAGLAALRYAVAALAR